MTRKARRAVKQMTNKPYDISKIYADMEIDLIKSMQRNLKRHLAEEEAYGFQWEQWQSMKLRELAQYRKEVDKTIQEYGGKAKREARAYTEQSFLSGGAGTNAFYSRFRPELAFDEALFFSINRRLVDTLTASVQNDLARAEHAVLRMTDDVYRKTVFKSQMYYNMGAANLWQAVDMATADFLSKGYNAVVYKNGNRVNIASYAEMAIRTTAKRASLSGAGARQNELGERLCYIPGRGMACELCVPWLSRVYIDDVYAGGKPTDGPYPLLSTAIAGGIFHPNCRDGRYPYYKGVTNAPKPLTDEEKELSVERYEQEQKQRYMERNVRKYKRLEAGSLSLENKGKYGDKVRQWQERLRSQTKENDFLRRNYAREAIGKRAGANIRLQNAEKSGIINTGRDNAMTVDVLVDKFTPCLVERKTGNIISTSYSKADKTDLKGLRQSGWLFDWTSPELSGADIFKLSVKNKTEIEGLVAVTDMPRDKAVFVNIAESAPHNRGGGQGI